MHLELANFDVPMECVTLKRRTKEFSDGDHSCEEVEDRMQPVFELVFDPSSMDNVDHDAVFVTLVTGSTQCVYI